MCSIFGIFKRKSNKIDTENETIINPNTSPTIRRTEPVKKTPKKPSPIGEINKTESQNQPNCITNTLIVEIPNPDVNSNEDIYTKSDIGYDYNKDKLYDFQLHNVNTIEYLFKNIDIKTPIILRGNWKKKDIDLKEGWMVPCYFCWQLTTRKIAYLEKHMVYACKECLPKNMIN